MNWGFETEFDSISCIKKTFNYKRHKHRSHLQTHTPLLVVLKYSHLNLILLRRLPLDS